MNAQLQNPEDKIMQIILGKWISKPLYIAAKLEIADLIGNSTFSCDIISKQTQTDTTALYRLLRALTCAGIFHEHPDQRFSNTPMSCCLKKGQLQSAVLMFQSGWHDAAWKKLYHAVKTGESAFESAHGKPSYEWFKAHTDEAAVFHDANSKKAAVTHSAVLGHYDFSDVDEITDIGGGTGGLAIALLKRYPHLKATIAELPENIPFLGKEICKNNLQERITGRPCDFFIAIPITGRVCLLSHVLHNWPDDKAQTLLRNIRQNIPADGRLLIVEAIIPEPNTFSIAKLMDLEMLVMGKGMERTAHQFERLLKRAGFKISDIKNPGHHPAVIEALPDDSR